MRTLSKDPKLNASLQEKDACKASAFSLPGISFFAGLIQTSLLFPTIMYISCQQDLQITL